MKAMSIEKIEDRKIYLAPASEEEEKALEEVLIQSVCETEILGYKFSTVFDMKVGSVTFTGDDFIIKTLENKTYLTTDSCHMNIGNEGGLVGLLLKEDEDSYLDLDIAEEGEFLNSRLYKLVVR